MIAKQCKHNENDLVLHFYGETDSAQTAQIVARLEVCPSCREYFAGLAEMESIFPRTPSVEPDNKVMAAIRRATEFRIAELASSKNRLERSGGMMTWSLGRRVALAGVTVFAAFLFGRSSVQFGDHVNSFDPDPMLSTISDLQYDAESGLINVYFRTERQSVVSGSVNDADIQLMLGMALADAGNPSARLRAAKLLSQVDLDSIAPNREFVDALEGILRNESNIGMRLQAVKALRRVHGTRALSESLSGLLLELLETSSNSALRMEILELLTQSELARQEWQRILERAATDENSYIRYRARTELDAIDSAVRLEDLN